MQDGTSLQRVYITPINLLIGKFIRNLDIRYRLERIIGSAGWEYILRKDYAAKESL